MLNSYEGVGGTTFSVNFSTQKYRIFDPFFKGFFHILGVNIILGGGGEKGSKMGSRGCYIAIILLLGAGNDQEMTVFGVISDTAYLVEADYQWGNCGLPTGTESCRVFRQPPQMRGPHR